MILGVVAWVLLSRSSGTEPQGRGHERRALAAPSPRAARAAEEVRPALRTSRLAGVVVEVDDAPAPGALVCVAPGAIGPSFALGWRPDYGMERLVEAAWAYERAPDDPRRIWYPG